MLDILNFEWTDGSDTFVSDSGVLVYYNTEVNTQAGNDTIIGSGMWYGIGNYGLIDTGTGNDIIIGSGSGYGIENYGKILTDTGNDIITGITKNERYYGIENYGLIDTGTGNDKITGSGGRIGIRNAGLGLIDTGTGNDIITGSGTDDGIVNLSTIDTGNGNDIITGSGLSRGILNAGTILTGDGNDIVDALNGGFGGGGTIDLGAGDDTLKGHGTGTFKGGTGTDTMIFAAGTYVIDGDLQSGFQISLGSTMGTYQGFEQIRGISGDLLALQAGTLMVNANGEGSFLV